MSEWTEVKAHLKTSSSNINSSTKISGFIFVHVLEANSLLSIHTIVHVILHIINASMLQNYFLTVIKGLMSQKPIKLIDAIIDEEKVMKMMRKLRREVSLR